jgi:non-specific serine/threonine protein kinase
VNVLPASPGPLIGREVELAELCARVSNRAVRLLTLCGPGGVGKTRLALEVARAAQFEFVDGARFVELAPFREPALVLSAMLAAIRPGQSTNLRPPLDALKHALQSLDVLLVLDNLEQVLEAAPQLADLLAACPKLTILATSRAPLRLSWEHEVPISPLEVPPSSVRSTEDLLGCPSVELLVERMAGLGVRGDWDGVELASLAGVCRRLDGIPLALELAAARARLLPPAELLARLERPLDLLSAGMRDSPDRHQALRTTFGWSYELLGESDRRLFRHLGVFVGGCTFDAAARVCDLDAGEIAFVDALGRLIDSGLVSRVQHKDPRPRLHLLEPVREYALEQLQPHAELEAAQERHALAYLDLAELVEPMLFGPHESEWLPRLEPEHANTLVALRWFLNRQDVERSLRLAAALASPWLIRGFTREGLGLIEEALALTPAQPEDESQRVVRGTAFSRAGALTYWTGDWQRAMAYQEAALLLFGKDAEPRRRQVAMFSLGTAALGAGDVDRAEAHIQQALELARANGDQVGVTGATMNLGLVATYREDYARAQALLSEAAPLLTASGNFRSAAHAWRFLAMVQCHTGDVAAAQASMREGLVAWTYMRDAITLPLLLESAAFVTVAAGDAVRALQLGGAATALRGSAGMPPRSGRSSREAHRALERAREAIDPDASAEAWAAGARLSLEEALQLALGEPHLGGQDKRETLPAGLTRREAEVLRMLASGSTNKEIASELSLSLGTVERHITNLYAKIGARGRAEATAFALTRGLLS